jgi:hypothetical protein
MINTLISSAYIIRFESLSGGGHLYIIETTMHLHLSKISLYKLGHVFFMVQYPHCASTVCNSSKNISYKVATIKLLM